MNECFGYAHVHTHFYTHTHTSLVTHVYTVVYIELAQTAPENLTFGISGVD